MCGILGVVCFDCNVRDMLKDGLKKLEYRGYDSAGFCILNGSTLNIVKKTGTVDEVSQVPEFKNLEGHMGIAHTRWATHGGVNDENAHPFLSHNKRIVVVHNGIIDNCVELRKELDGKVSFSSQTDSEIIAHLIDLNYVNDFKQAVLSAISYLKGSFAFIALSNSGEMAIVKRESPVCVGYSKNNFYFSSDVIPLVGKAENITFMDDGEICFFKNGITFTDFKGNVIQKTFSPLKNDFTEAQKGVYSHYTIKEIFEVPRSILNSSKIDETVLQEIKSKVMSAKKIILLGCGTSFHACLYGEKKLRELGLNAEAILASDFTGELPLNALVIAVSQSGETADVLKLLKNVEKEQIICIVNRQNSTLDRTSSVSYQLNSGFEIGVASTKSYCAQIVAFELIAASINNSVEETRKKISDCSEWLSERMEGLEDKAKQISKELVDKNSAFILGSGINFVTAKEIALKIKEISYLHAEALAAGELKHGSLALVSKGFPVIIFSEDDNQASIHEVKARGAKTYLISPFETADFIIPKEFYSLASVVPGQLIAYYTALYKNVDPDKPKNLAKSCTVI